MHFLHSFRTLAKKRTALARNPAPPSAAPPSQPQTKPVVKRFPQMTRPFGVGRSPKPGPYVEHTPRLCVYDLDLKKVVAGTPFKARAREGSAIEQVHVVINGRPAVLDVVCDARFLGGGQRYFLCPNPMCSRKVWHLYVQADEQADGQAGERLACRRCVPGLDYRSKHTRRQGVNRVRRLREKIGAPALLLSPIPLRPHGWRKDYWRRTIAQLLAAEASIAKELHVMIPRVRRRLKRDRHRAT